MKHFLATLIFLQLILLPATAFAVCQVGQCTNEETGDCYVPVTPGVCNTSTGAVPATPSAPATYTLMAPLFGEIGLGSSPSLTTYLQGIVQVAIGLAGVLAVIMIVVCGIKLMGTPSSSGKSEAKECIWNAIFGVLLAVGAWILLYTINPLLLSKELRLTDVAQAPPASTTGPVDDRRPTEPGWYFRVQDASGAKKYVYAGPPNIGGDACNQIAAKATNLVEGCFVILAPTTVIGQDEAGVRIAICGQETYDKNKCKYAQPLGINNLPCNPPTLNGVVNGCTNVAGLPGDAVNFIQTLPGLCNCNVIITGGTENGHTSHAQNLPVFDLGKATRLVTLVKTSGVGPNASFCKTSTGTCFSKWLYQGYWFTDEGNHWHVCKDGTPAPSADKVAVFKKACTKV